MEKQLGKYILPNTLAMVGTSCYVLADTFFISVANGTDGITALNLVLPVYSLLFALGSMIGVGSATRYALGRSTGAEDASEYFSNSFWCTLLVSSIFVGCGIWFPEQILTLLGADPGILQTGLAYTRIVLCFAPFFMLNYTFTAFVRNDHAPNLVMTATLVSGIFNILFDFIFMFPMGMGMTGAALATGISPIISISVCLLHFLSPSNTLVFSKKWPSLRKLVSACNLGISALVGELSGGVTTMLFNYILLGLAGNVAVAAYGVIANMALVATALLNGVSLGLQPVASAVHGQMDEMAQQRLYRQALRIGFCIIGILVGLTLLFSDGLIAMFNSSGSQQLADYASVGLKIYFLGYLIACVNIIRSGFYSAVGKGMLSSVIALSRGVVTIVLMAFLLSRIWGMTGVWLAFPVSEGLTWLLTMVITRYSAAKRG